jgi:hypothetical protein
MNGATEGINASTAEVSGDGLVGVLGGWKNYGFNHVLSNREGLKVAVGVNNMLEVNLGAFFLH